MTLIGTKTLFGWHNNNAVMLLLLLPRLSREDVPSETLRSTWLDFPLPGFDGRFRLLSMTATFWIDVVCLLVLQVLFCGVFSYLIYHQIVKQRSKIGETSPSGYLFGYGVVIPLALVAPFGIIALMRLKNLAAILGTAAFAVTVPFHCLEAMYNTSEPGAEKNFLRYFGYISSVIPFQRDKTGLPIPTNAAYILRKCGSFLLSVTTIILSFQVLLQFDDYAVILKPDYSSMLHYFHWRHLLNNFVLACLTSSCLHFGTLGMGLLVSLVTGNRTINVMENPILLSTSASEFWGRRWNLIIHGSFKRGVYKPLRKSGYSRAIAAVSAFAVSGLFHEYVNLAVSMKARLHPEIARPYTPQWGTHSAFFLWNGVIMSIEYALSGSQSFQKLAKYTLRPLKTAFVLLSVMPLAHLFTDEYVRSGFYNDYSEGFPLLVYSK